MKHDKKPNWIDSFLFPSPKPSYNRRSFPGQLKFIPMLDTSCARLWEKVIEGHEKIHLPPLLSQSQFKQRISCLFLLHPNPQFVCIYLHGNGTDIGKLRSVVLRLQHVLTVPVTFVLVEYPGYGCQLNIPEKRVRPCASNIEKAVESVYWYIRLILQWDSSRILFMGRSMGSGPACQIASQFKVGGLVLISPFKSIKAMISTMIGSFVAKVIEERFDNWKAVQKIQCPVLFIHGENDMLIPSSHSIELYQSCPSRIKILAISPGMSHSDFDMLDDWVRPIETLVEKIIQSGFPVDLSLMKHSPLMTESLPDHLNHSFGKSEHNNSNSLLSLESSKKTSNRKNNLLQFENSHMD